MVTISSTDQDSGHSLSAGWGLAAALGPVMPPRRPAPWIAERARLLERVCKRVARDVSAGSSLNSALKKAARRLKARTYRVDPDRRVRLGFGALFRHWHNWRRDGTRRAFALNYKPGMKSSVSPDDARRFLVACTCARSMIAASRHVGGQGGKPNYGQLIRVLSPKSRRVVLTYQRSKLRHERAKKALDTLLASAGAPNRAQTA
jgi:hypothetical protein